MSMKYFWIVLFIIGTLVACTANTKLQNENSFTKKNIVEIVTQPEKKAWREVFDKRVDENRAKHRENPANLYPVKARNGKYGYVNKTGEWVVEPIFKYNEEFSSKPFTTVKVDKNNLELGYLKKNGELVLIPEIAFVHSFSNVNGKTIFQVRKKGLWGLLDEHNNWVVKPKFSTMGKPSEGFISVGLGNKKGYINYDGEWKIDVGTHSAGNEWSLRLSEFENGLAVISTGLREKSKFSVIDQMGNWNIVQRDAYISGFDKNGFASFSSNGASGIIHRSGSIAVQPKYSNISKIGSYWYGESYGKFGRIDTEGNWIFAPLFDNYHHASIYYGGHNFDFVTASINKKWGLVSPTGTWAIPPNYEYIFLALNGLMRVKLNGKWGVIDIDRNWILKPEFSSIDIYDEVIKVSSGDDVFNQALTTLEGKYIVSIKDGVNRVK